VQGVEVADQGHQGDGNRIDRTCTNRERSTSLPKVMARLLEIMLASTGIFAASPDAAFMWTDGV